VIIVLIGTVLLFFLQELLEFSSSFIALSAAGVALLWVRPNTQELFERIEWSVLVFFIALFVMVGGLESSGALDRIAEVMTEAASLNPILLGIIFIWVVAILSAIVDNIPITIALIPVIIQHNHRLLGQYCCCLAVRTDTHPHHICDVDQARFASNDSRLCHSQHPICNFFPFLQPVAPFDDGSFITRQLINPVKSCS
jgi:hypothetical protein